MGDACQRCGRQYPGRGNFCPHCGAARLVSFPAPDLGPLDPRTSPLDPAPLEASPRHAPTALLVTAGGEVVGVVPPVTDQSSVSATCLGPTSTRNEAPSLPAIFPIWALVLLHYLTLGVFSMVWVNLYHGSLSRERADDPTAGQAVGYLFVPIYGLYWIFFTHLRLCERLYRDQIMAGLARPNLRAFALWCCIVEVVPYVNFLGTLITYPVLAGLLQHRLSELSVRLQVGLERSDVRAARAHPLSVWSMICGVLSLMVGVPGVAGLVTGKMALREPSGYSGASSGLAVAGMILSSLGILVWLLVVVSAALGA